MSQPRPSIECDASVQPSPSIGLDVQRAHYLVGVWRAIVAFGALIMIAARARGYSATGQFGLKPVVLYPEAQAVPGAQGERAATAPFTTPG